MPPKFAAKRARPAYQPTRGASTKLVIVESPSKCRKIEEYLGPDYRCVATLGHFREIKGLSAIDIKGGTFAIKYTLVEEKVAHIATLGKTIAQYEAGSVLLATDDDREGEAIAWHIADHFGLPVAVAPRILFHEITAPELLRAVANPTILRMGLVRSQQARQVIDMLVGFKVSPVLWKYVCNNKQDALSAGRCQSVALRLVYENHVMCEAADGAGDGAAKFRVVANLTAKSLPFQHTRMLDTEAEAEALLAAIRGDGRPPPFALKMGEARAVSVPPPRPLTTARLLQTLTQYPPAVVMQMCQTLYQDGHITYMRTDCAKYSPVFLEAAAAYIAGRYGGGHVAPDLAGLAAGGAAGPAAHEAIRPTHIGRDFIQADDNRLNVVYRFIWRTTVESCMAAETQQEIAVRATRADLRSSAAEFIYRLEIPVFAGWRAVATKPAEWSAAAEQAAAIRAYLAALKGGEAPCLSAEATAVLERAQTHYSEASLIHRLEELGIGRPSTFAYIVQTLLDRGYAKRGAVEGAKRRTAAFQWAGGEAPIVRRAVEHVVGRETGKLLLQNMGLLVAEFLLQHFPTLLSYEYTGQMETELDAVADGADPSAEYVRPCLKCVQGLKEWMAPLRRLEKRVFPLVDGIYEVVLSPGGISLRHTLPSGEVEYRMCRDGLQVDMGRLERGEVPASEILEFPDGNEVLGHLDDGAEVRICRGKYGYYLRVGGAGEAGRNVAVPKGLDIHRLTWAGAQGLIRGEVPAAAVVAAGPPAKRGRGEVLRVIDGTTSIKLGKVGAYIQKPPAFPGGKPQFVSLKKFPGGDYMTCSLDELRQFAAASKAEN